MCYIKYFLRLLRHKHAVGLVCLKMGLWRHALKHDLSRFYPDEFIPYARYSFVSEDRYMDAYLAARALHSRRNKHHFSHWIIRVNGRQEALPMPEEHIKEMICDWAAFTNGCITGAIQYFEDERHSMDLHPKTIRIIEKIFNIGGDEITYDRHQRLYR